MTDHSTILGYSPFPPPVTVYTSATLSFPSFWFIKWLVVIGVIIAYFFIPEGDDFVFSTSEISG